MQDVPIQAVPNQQFTIVLDDNQWDITIKTTAGVTSVSLALNGVPLITNARAVANMKIIQAEYQETAGNFAFVSQGQNLPDYTQFGTTQALVYISVDELADARVRPTFPITAEYFDPIAPLPLRFAPQGYTLAP